MTFVPENDLERLLVDAATKEASRPAFLRALLDSELFVLGDLTSSDVPFDTPTTVEKDTKARFRVAKEDGHDYILLFSSLPRLTAFIKSEESYLRMRARDIFQNTPGAYYVLNPGAPYGKEFLPEEVARLLNPQGAASTITLTEPTQVLIGQPKVYPWTLMQALGELFRARNHVQAAYIAQVAGLQGLEPHPLVGIEATGDWDRLSEEVGQAILTAHPGQPVDVIRVERGDAGLSSSLLRYPPFYIRANA